MVGIISLGLIIAFTIVNLDNNGMLASKKF